MSGELLSSFDKSWEEFSAAWKKARSKASEKSIHDLRVNTRRLIATLELARALSRKNEITKLQRRFKKVLKRMGPLRDVQVQLEGLSHMRQAGLIPDFKKALQRRERRRIDGVRDDLKRGTKQQLSRAVKDVHSEFTRVHALQGEEKIRRSVDRLLTTRRNEFIRAERRFQKQQHEEEPLHVMRIALKKLRYAVEAAAPLIGDWAKERAKQMQAFQQLMGDTRDVELLRAELEKWAAKKGKKIAVAPALERLLQKRQVLLKKIIRSSAQFEEVVRADTPRPVVEKTHAAASAASGVEKAKVKSAAAS